MCGSKFKNKNFPMYCGALWCTCMQPVKQLWIATYRGQKTGSDWLLSILGRNTLHALSAEVRRKKRSEAFNAALCWNQGRRLVLLFSWEKRTKHTLLFYLLLFHHFLFSHLRLFLLFLFPPLFSAAHSLSYICSTLCFFFLFSSFVLLSSFLLFSSASLYFLPSLLSTLWSVFVLWSNKS